MRIGVFGGTFDPPHIAHLILAAEAFDQLGLQQILWVLTPDPPHKPERPVSPLPDRLAMLQSAIGDNPFFELSHVDMERPAPYYAVDTMRLLKAEMPHAELIYLMGGDSLRDLPLWHRPDEFVAACDAIGVMCRTGGRFDLAALETVLPGITEKVEMIEAPLVEISSSTIRERAAKGRTFRYFLPPPVYQIILSQRLYR